MKIRHRIVFFVKKCFYCGKKHRLDISTEELSVDVCSQCKKSWCYFFNKCKKDSPAGVCGKCNKGDGNYSPIGKDPPPPSLSPITTQCNEDKLFKLHTILPDLLKLDFDEKRQHDEWKHILMKNFTRLYPKNHNMFHLMK